MERGVKTIVCKWRGRLFDVKRGSFRHKETPFSNREGRFVNSRILLPLFPLTILSHPTSSFHAPLHSERGWGEASSQLEKGVSFNSKILLPLFLLTILFHPTSSFHAPLHSERGRGWGCRWLRVRLLFLLMKASASILAILIYSLFGTSPPFI